MRKFFYGISVFLFLCVLSLGYYRTYQMAEGGRTAAESPIGPEEQEKDSFQPGRKWIWKLLFKGSGRSGGGVPVR